jgi:hypothetical protein
VVELALVSDTLPFVGLTVSSVMLRLVAWEAPCPSAFLNQA